MCCNLDTINETQKLGLTSDSCNKKFKKNKANF